MTEPAEPDTRLWLVRWSTINGQQRAGVMCTEHKRRHESACASLDLPRPTTARLDEPTKGQRCRSCQGRPIGTTQRAIFGRATGAVA